MASADNGRGKGWRKYFGPWEAGEENHQGDVRAYCPIHEDPATSTSPSAVFNYHRGIWNCLGSPACAEEIGGNLQALFEHLQPAGPKGPKARSNGAKRRESAWDDDAPTYTEEVSKELPSTDTLRRWHEALVSRPDVLGYLKNERGLKDGTIRRFGLGYDAGLGRYTIPIFVDGKLVNVRRYNPRADAKSKMLNWPGTHQSLFNDQVLQDHDEVVLCEGELDTMVAAQHGIAAVGHTGGARTWDPKLTARFKGKSVFVCYDCDDAGMEGARKVATSLTVAAAHVYIVRLPLPYDGSDLTDYFVNQGHSPAEFKKILKETAKEEFSLRTPKEPPSEAGTVVSLTDSMNPVHMGPIEMRVTVAGKQDPPYDVPRRVRYTCTMDAGKQCQVCPMLMLGGTHEDTIDPDEPVLLQFVDTSDKQVHEILRERIGAKKCDRLDKEWLEKSSLEDILVTNSVEHLGEEAERPTERHMFIVGTYKTPVNTAVRIVGRNLPDPRSQRQAFLGWIIEPTQSNLDRFEVNDDTVKRLKVFQPLPDQTPLKRMGEIAADLAANVTHIYGRPELHIAYDLVWHSAMDFKFERGNIGRGWLELVVVGDTRTGKSDVAHNLRKHYNAGVVQSCEGMTFAGLVGGVQQIRGRWMVTWGLIPLQDRRLVVLDEVSGLKDKDVIEQMSAIRSSGVAQLTKIQSASTIARTRLVWISNPITGQALDEITGGGMKALQDLVKNPEDVARFDFALAAGGPDVPSSMINTTKREAVPHVFTAELCAELVMWAWSRRADDIRISKGTEAYIVEAAEAFGARYVADPPLVQQQNVREKLARLAVAVALRTFSTEDGRRVIVRREHVDAAVAFLDHVYGKESFGYMRHSRRELAAKVRAREQHARCRRFLLENDDVLIGLKAVMQSSEFRVRDFQDFANMDSTSAQIAARKLMEMGMVRRKARGAIVMTAELVNIMREFED